jgi:hypothetical protein
MSAAFDRDALLDAFDKIGRAAAQAGTKLQIAVYGGSALMLASNFMFATRMSTFPNSNALYRIGWQRSCTRSPRKIVGTKTGSMTGSHFILARLPILLTITWSLARFRVTALRQALSFRSPRQNICLRLS